MPRHAFHLLLIALACTLAACSNSLTIADLQHRKVIGELGLPLGTVVEVRGVIIAGEETGSKGDSGERLLNVTQIDGRELPMARVFHYGILFQSGSSQDKNKVDNVGKAVHWLVFEAGDFAGIPEHMAHDVEYWQDRGFGFSTYLRAVADRN